MSNEMPIDFQPDAATVVDFKPDVSSPEEQPKPATDPYAGWSPSFGSLPAPVKEQLQKPTVSLPRVELTPLEEAFAQDSPNLLVRMLPKMAGIANLAASTGEELSVPLSLETLPVGMTENALARAASLIFSAQGFAKLPSQLQQAVTILRDTNAPESKKIEIAGNPIVNAFLSGSMFMHGILPKEPPTTPLETKAVEIKPVAPLTAEAVAKVAAQPKEESAVQIQSPNEDVLRAEQPQVELPQVGARNPEPQISAGTQETPVSGTQGEVGPPPESPPTVPESKPLPTFEQVEVKVKRGEPLSANEQAVWDDRMMVKPEQGPGIVGLGAAERGEVGTGAGGETFGIAERVRQQRAAAGVTEPVPPGEGIAAPDSVEHGRQLLASGTDPEAVLSRFEQTKALSHDDMAVVRAHGEALAQNARLIEEAHGTDSPEYRDAFSKVAEWDRRSKAMQTEWHKTGMAQQGETDIDTGTFTGLQRAYTESTGKTFTPKQAGKAKDLSGQVAGAQDASAAAHKNLAAEISKKTAQSTAEKRALDAANLRVREAAILLAEQENKRRIAQAELKTAADLARQEPAAQSGASISEQARREAIAQAKAENKSRLKAAQQKAKVAEVQARNARKALEAVQQRAIRAAASEAAAARKEQANPVIAVWRKATEYLNEGKDNFDEIRHKIATDLGMPVSRVTRLLTREKQVKYLADEVWRKQQVARRLQNQAKRWLNSQTVPLYVRALSSVPRFLFSLRVGFHGTVALGTHAPMVAFQPRFWSTYVRDFGKMYKMVANPAYYEMQIQDLQRRPNYITARRAGLINDPFVYEDYNSPQTTAYFGNLTGMGNRGYSVLKILRQDMFDQHWDSLPKINRIPQIAQALADGINHATGVVKGRAPKGANILLFAPRLEASRVMWLAGDPIRAARAFADWKNASLGDRAFAMQQLKEKAWVAGTLTGLLALNQGFLSATGSDQKINFDDPFKGDWLKFKLAGMQVSYGNAMITMARLPVRLYQIRESSGGKLRNLVYPDEDTYTVLGEYGRSQMSPFASLATDLWLKSDWMRRPLPSSNRPVPKRLRQQGVQPYTWPEFWTEQSLPIPFQEGLREVWRAQGMDVPTQKKTEKMLASIAVVLGMGGTGARIVEDWNINPK